jgi:uncharacterized phage protein (TIGR02218 family)
VKTITDEFKSHLEGEVTTVAICWKITRKDGQQFFFTDHDRDVVVDGDTYEAASGVLPMSMTQKDDLSVPNMNAVAFLSSDKIVEADIVAGLFDEAVVDIFAINYEEH